MRRKIFAVTDPVLINTMLMQGEYGTLALYGSDRGQPPAPYAVPLNYVYHDGDIYFHGSPKGKKMRLLKENPRVSFSIVTETNIIPSYFSSTEGLACPATAFFKSINIDGRAEIIEDRNDIAQAFGAMMRTLQPEGQYKDFSDPAYDQEFKALVMVKIQIIKLEAKFKFGQNVDQESFQMIVDNLKKRSTTQDQKTCAEMLKIRPLP